MSGDKLAVRRRMGALRRAVGPDAREGLLGALERTLRSERRVLTLGIYSPIGSEPDAGDVFARWVREAPGRSLALPWCLNREASEMEYRRWMPGEPLAPDAAGIAAPTGPCVVPDALVIPCLGWSRSRRRLGYGGGYFDRYIAHVMQTGCSPRLLGLGYGVNEVDEGIFEAHDLPLDLIITDAGVF